jgi:hypothetical protein
VGERVERHAVDPERAGEAVDVGAIAAQRVRDRITRLAEVVDRQKAGGARGAVFDLGGQVELAVA